MAMPDARTELTGLDLTFVVPRLTASRAVVRRMSKELDAANPKRGSVREPTVLREALLAEDDAAKWYVFFHVDETNAPNDDNRELYFVHLRYQERPSGKPPPSVLRLAESGHRSGWLLKRLVQLLAATPEPLTLVDASLDLKDWQRRPGLVVASPLNMDDVVLVGTGAEYRAKTPGRGVRKFRWSEQREGHILAWLSYFVEAKWDTLDLWAEERQRCERYLQKLL